jgi:hypothetical protein
MSLPEPRKGMCSMVPPLVVAAVEDNGHAVVDLTNDIVRVCSDDRESAHPFAGGTFPVLPESGQPKGQAVSHGDSVGLLGLHSLEDLPFEEAVNWHDATPMRVSFAKHWLQVNGLRHRIDRTSPAFLILEPVGDQAPAQGFKRPLAVLWFSRMTSNSWLGAPL